MRKFAFARVWTAEKTPAEYLYQGKPAYGDGIYMSLLEGQMK
jgi:hypothetical protein